MTKQLLAGVAAVILMSGVASAQTYPPASPPGTPIPEIPPAVSGSSTSTTTTVARTPDGGYRSSTTQTGVDEYGNPVTKKDTYREGVAGSSETHSKTETDPTGAGHYHAVDDDHHATLAGARRETTDACSKPKPEPTAGDAARAPARSDAASRDRSPVANTNTSARTPSRAD